MLDKASLITETAPLAGESLQREIAGLFVLALNLDVVAEDIDPDAPLYGSGLGLDSIDALELVAMLDQAYGVLIEERAVADKAFVSVRALAEFVTTHRK